MSNLDVDLGFPVEVEPSARDACKEAVREALHAHLDANGIVAPLGVESYASETSKVVHVFLGFEEGQHWDGVVDVTRTTVSAFLRGNYDLLMMNSATRQVITPKAAAA